MSTLTFYSKMELLPDHLKQQVLDYIDFLLSREAKPGQPVQKQEKTDKNELKQPKAALQGVFLLRQLNNYINNLKKCVKNGTDTLPPRHECGH